MGSLAWQGDEPAIRCHCGAFLHREPDSREPAEYRKTCDGKWAGKQPWPSPSGVIVQAERYTEPPACGKLAEHESHDYVYSACTVLHRQCKRCKRDNQEAEL